MNKNNDSIHDRRDSTFDKKNDDVKKNDNIIVRTEKLTMSREMFKNKEITFEEFKQMMLEI
jgi:hypothetical protein